MQLCAALVGTIVRHNGIRDLLLHMPVSVYGQSRVEAETRGIIPASGKKPGDITVKGWSCGRDLVLDVT